MAARAALVVLKRGARVLAGAGRCARGRGRSAREDAEELALVLRPAEGAEGVAANVDGYRCMRGAR